MLAWGVALVLAVKGVKFMNTALVCVCVCVYVYTHTHTYTHMIKKVLWLSSDTKPWCNNEIMLINAVIRVLTEFVTAEIVSFVLLCNLLEQFLNP
jgi:hypothetical protein